MAVLTCSTRVTHRLHRRGHKTDEEEETAASALLEVTQLLSAPRPNTQRHGWEQEGPEVQGAFEQGTEATTAPSGQQETIGLTHIYTLDYILLTKTSAGKKLVPVAVCPSSKEPTVTTEQPARTNEVPGYKAASRAASRLQLADSVRSCL
ncbi:Hypothetical predicted protein [Scomber scombrus]|uniref:Uncharacterized protein n=1 Tax=Scomber scombrus TaxID=13677 RepID=A0AAV1P8D8_SCOSC